MKRLILVMLAVALSLAASGCGGGGGSTRDAEIQAAIGARINDFVTAVEDYDVDSMLAFLDSANFDLAIKEGLMPEYSKTYAQLEAELRLDEAKQLHWREPVPQGHGYVLTMTLGTITYTSLTETGALATATFVIEEEADGLSRVTTDTGTIDCEMVKLAGQWLCRSMTIRFDAVPTRTLSRAALLAGSGDNQTGFGFGRLSF